MIILPAQIEGLTSRKDKTIKVTFGTQELTPVDAAQVFQLNQRFCYIAIKEESFQQEELDNIDSIKTDLESNKTPSQRLRGILYISYQQNDEGFKDFMTYYISKMDKLCEHFKSKLDK
jgi:isopentenyldiphosphate isomerase